MPLARCSRCAGPSRDVGWSHEHHSRHHRSARAGSGAAEEEAGLQGTRAGLRDVNALAWTIWALTGAGFPWPVFVTGGWGIGVVMNAWDVYWRQPITEADVRREIERLGRS